MTGRRIRVVSAILLAIAAISTASASQLVMEPASATLVSSHERCSNTAVNVTATDSQSLTISGIDTAACAGLPLELWVSDGTKTATAAVASIVSGKESVTLSNSVDVAKVQAKMVMVKVGNWPIPSTWTNSSEVPVPLLTCVVPGSDVSCSAAITAKNSWGSEFIYDVTITTNSATPVPWMVTINLSMTPDPFPFVANEVNEYSGGAGIFYSQSACNATPRTMTVRNGDWRTISKSQSQVLKIDGRQAASGKAAGGQVLLSCP